MGFKQKYEVYKQKNQKIYGGSCPPSLILFTFRVY